MTQELNKITLPTGDVLFVRTDDVEDTGGGCYVRTFDAEGFVHGRIDRVLLAPFIVVAFVAENGDMTDAESISLYKNREQWDANEGTEIDYCVDADGNWTVGG